jgi:hypothetical protein
MAEEMTAEQLRAIALAKARQKAAEAEPSTLEKVKGGVEAFGNGIVNMATLGYGDEIGAGLDYAGSHVLPWRDPKTYDQALDDIRTHDKTVAEQHPVADMAGKVTGIIGGAAGLARAGLSPTANAITRGAGLGRVAATSAGEGAVLGGVSGFGSGEGVEGRLTGAGTGAVIGGGVGAAAPLVVAGASKLLSPVVAPVAARLFPNRYAEQAIGEGVRRSGMSADDIAQSLERAGADGQNMFNVADAMGLSGRRMLSTVTKTPNDARQAVVDALVARQTGQGDRLSNFLAEGFGAPDTAAQRAASLTGERTAAANANYGAARQGANPVNLNNAVGEIDTLLGRDPILGETALSAGPLGPRLRALRDQLARGGEQLVDFDKVLNIKSDLFQQMQRNPQVANDMRGVYSQLDAALENASDGYRAANDTFRTQSKAIDAVDAGRSAASGRVRADDSVPAFTKMSPEEQAAFRAGYVDPLISRVESTSMAPLTNKARPLMTPKTGAEFPAFAEPGRGEQLGTRIAREQRMFETSSAALGGSSTSENLADAAEMAKFDPGVMSKLLKGDIPGALIDGARRLISEGAGLPPRVVEQVGRALMETDPAVARALLSGGADRLSRNDALRARVVQALTHLGAAGAGRIAAP